MEIFLHPETYVALLTLIILEIVLGVDNIIFISIVTNKLPHKLQKRARVTGLTLAMGFRVFLLLTITWLISFTHPLFSIGKFAFSARDMILLIGGLFLIAKSTSEISSKMEGPGAKRERDSNVSNFFMAIVQIIMLDIIFSFDSILTAIGLTDQVILMIIAVIVAIVIMMIFAEKISDIIRKHPSLEILALAFLILIGFTLVLDAIHTHVPKGYVYSAVAFSLSVQMILIRMKKNTGTEPVQLKRKMEKD
ncbi:MAG: TerC family protein [Cyclobacteriaceae bacterium]|nr:TerC family protein [Cyclobacteriaceae bacterium]